MNAVAGRIADPSPFARAYADLSELGYHPIPLIPANVTTHRGKGKAPGAYVSGGWRGLDSWQDLRTAPLSGFKLSMALRMPDANIGVCMGTPAGKALDGTPLFVMAVDIDTEDADAFDEIVRAIPQSGMRAKGKKGFKAFYRAPETVKSRGYDDARIPMGQGLPRRLVDVLTGFDTRQAVVSPSIHPDGGAVYSWLAGPVRADELPIFSEDDLERLVETLQTLGYDPEAGRQGRAERKPYVRADHDGDDVFDRVKAAALANLSAWIHDVPGLYGLRPARGGFECVNTLRDSSSGQPLERRKRNLSINPRGIRDMGSGDTWSAVDFVADFVDLSISEAVNWLEDHLFAEDEGGVVIDFEAMLASRADRSTGNPIDDEADLPEPLRGLGPTPERETPAPSFDDAGAREAVLGGEEKNAAAADIRPTHAPARSAGRTIDFNDWRSSRLVGHPPEIQWLIRDVIPLAIPAMVAAQGDAGKSMLLLDAARRIAFGANPLEGPCMGGMIERDGTAVIITAEDDAGAIHRRIANLDPTNARFSANGERLIVVPLPDAGGPLPLVREGRRGLEATDEYKRLADQLAAIDDLAMVVFDPLQAFVHAPINEDPAAGQFTCSLLATLAARTQASVIVAHHTRKPSSDRSKGIKTLQEAREMVRGTTALVDGLRLVYALWAETDGDARKVCQRLGVDFEANRVIRGGVVKANGPSRRRIATYVRNEIGLLVDQSMMLSEAPSELQEQMAVLAACVEKAARVGVPFTRTGQTGFEANKHRLPVLLQGLGRDRLIKVAEEALQRGLVVACTAKGSPSAKWLDVPGGPIAEGYGEFALGKARDQKEAA